MSQGSNIVDIFVRQGKKRPAVDDAANAPKRPAQAAPAPSTLLHVDQTLKTMRFQQLQLEEAAELWIRQKGGEDKLGDANATFLRTVRSALHSTSLQLQLAENQEKVESDEIADIWAQIEEPKACNGCEAERVYERIYNELSGELSEDMWRVVQKTVKHAFDDEQVLQDRRDYVLEVVREHVHNQPDAFLDEEMIEVKKYCLARMKAEKDAPESSQDFLREHGTEIGE